MIFINLTPHTINYYVDGKLDRSFEPSGIVARIKEETSIWGEVFGLKLVRKNYSTVENLPSFTKINDCAGEYIYIVSGLVKMAVGGRHDVIAPDTGDGAVRNDLGQIIGTKQFILS